MKRQFQVLRSTKSNQTIPAVWIVHRYEDEEGDEHTVIISSECRSPQDVERSISILAQDLDRAKQKALRLIVKTSERKAGDRPFGQDPP